MIILCPVCNGRTCVKKGFYPDEPERIKCKACVNGVIYDFTGQTYTFPTYPTPGTTNPNGLSNLVQCNNCKTWYSPGSGHSCTV